MPRAQEHVPRRRGWGGLPAIQRHHLAVCPSQKQKAAAAEAGVMTVHHAQGQSGSHDGVHRVTAAVHGRQGRLSRERMHGGHKTTTGGQG